MSGVGVVESLCGGSDAGRDFEAGKTYNLVSTGPAFALLPLNNAGLRVVTVPWPWLQSKCVSAGPAWFREEPCVHVMNLVTCEPCLMSSPAADGRRRRYGLR
jgi:hypothetical protein